MTGAQTYWALPFLFFFLNAPFKPVKAAQMCLNSNEPNCSKFVLKNIVIPFKKVIETVDL